jgi:hypothetical protein
VEDLGGLSLLFQCQDHIRRETYIWLWGAVGRGEQGTVLYAASPITPSIPPYGMQEGLLTQEDEVEKEADEVWKRAGTG